MKLVCSHAPLTRAAGLAAALFASSATAQAQTAYGVDSLGNLFSFALSAPGMVNSIGNLGFVPEAIDFRPGTSTLYAFDVTGAQARLYTVDTATGTPTPIGAGFATSGVTPGAYDISGATSFAFDFNPITLQLDGTIRIRLVGNDGTNLRLHSGTGGIAVVDGSINGIPGASLTGAAYTNSDVQTMGGPTALYYIDSANDQLLFSGAPNAGTVSSVGSLGVNVGLDVGFDIYSGGTSDVGYVVDTTGTNSANLYVVNLTTGQATLAGVVGSSFTGGFAIDQLSAIPEPSSVALLAGVMGLGFAASCRRRSV